MNNLVVLIVILIILLIALGGVVFILKYDKIPKDYPYIFNFENKGDSSIGLQTYINGYKTDKSGRIEPGTTGGTLVGPNFKNPKTGVGFKKEEIANVQFYIDTDGQLEFTSPNVTTNFTFSTDATSKGDPVDSNMMNSKGFYMFNFL